VLRGDWTLGVWTMICGPAAMVGDVVLFTCRNDAIGVGTAERLASYLLMCGWA
jgi:hypothetical protein